MPATAVNFCWLERHEVSCLHRLLDPEAASACVVDVWVEVKYWLAVQYACSTHPPSVPLAVDVSEYHSPLSLASFAHAPLLVVSVPQLVHTPPYDTRTALRNSNQRSNTVSEMPNVHCGGVCVALEGDQAVFYHPWDVEALPPMPHGDPTC